jgi:hypothetical protein
MCNRWHFYIINIRTQSTTKGDTFLISNNLIICIFLMYSINFFIFWQTYDIKLNYLS